LSSILITRTIRFYLLQGFKKLLNLWFISYGEALPKSKQMHKKNSTNKDKTKNKQTFIQYVLNTISVADFNTLPDALGISKRMTTIRLMDPTKMTFSMIQKLAPFLKDDLEPLVNQYELGYDKLTAREYTNLFLTKSE